MTTVVSVVREPGPITGKTGRKGYKKATKSPEEDLVGKSSTKQELVIKSNSIISQ